MRAFLGGGQEGGRRVPQGKISADKNLKVWSSVQSSSSICSNKNCKVESSKDSGQEGPLAKFEF